MLKDITRLSPCDMLVADTRGTVVLFCDGQILVRRFSLSGKTSRVTALEVQETGRKETAFMNSLLKFYQHCKLYLCLLVSLLLAS